MIQLGIWALVQSLVSIVCCCAPVYKPLLPANGFWGRLTSKVSQYRLRSSRSGGSGRLDESYATGRLENDSFERREETRVSNAESRSQSQRWLKVGVSGSSEGAACHEPTEVSRGWLVEDHRQPVPISTHGSYDDNIYMMNAIHVHRSVDIV